MCFQIQLQVGSFWPRKRLTEVRGGFVFCNPHRYKTRDWNPSVQDWDQSRPLTVDEECSAGLPQFCRAHHRNHHMWVTPAVPRLHTPPVMLVAVHIPSARGDSFKKMDSVCLKYCQFLSQSQLVWYLCAVTQWLSCWLLGLFSACCFRN